MRRVGRFVHQKGSIWQGLAIPTIPSKWAKAFLQNRRFLSASHSPPDLIWGLFAACGVLCDAKIPDHIRDGQGCLSRVDTLHASVIQITQYPVTGV